jgi:hypothetical protein
MYNFDLRPLIWLGALAVALPWAIFEGVCYFIPDTIESEHPIKPEIELVIKDNKVDTLYIYKEP